MESEGVGMGQRALSLHDFLLLLGKKIFLQKPQPTFPGIGQHSIEVQCYTNHWQREMRLPWPNQANYKILGREGPLKLLEHIVAP